MGIGVGRDQGLFFFFLFFFFYNDNLFLFQSRTVDLTHNVRDYFLDSVYTSVLYTDLSI